MSRFKPLSDGQISELDPPSPRSRSIRSNSTPWLHSSISEIPMAPAPPPLRKRHSAYVLSSAPDHSTAPVPFKHPLPNPARVVPVPTQGTQKPPQSTRRPSTATGSKEEVTPWELSPGPPADLAPRTSKDNLSNARSHSSSKSALVDVEEVTPWELFPAPSLDGPKDVAIPPLTQDLSSSSSAFVEEVTPWELFPAPIYNTSNPKSTPLKRTQPSSNWASASLSQSKSLSEMALARRRKSTGTKASKARPSPPISTTKPPSIQSRDAPPPATLIDTNKLAASRPASTTLKAPPKLTAQIPTSTTQIPTMAHPPKSTTKNLKFSTADRTILEELKRNINVRNAQFVIKGAGTNTSGIRPGKKHHPFSRGEVPFPRSYDREVLDLDIWETVFCQHICESLTWHVFETSPTKVLDLGCGTGTWILSCARTWKECTFTGLDVVPLHPDLQQIGSPDLASRITWTQANFLEGLPFPNDEFDYVHTKRIALGVPEDKWDFLMEEITRVMKPGGAFEMVEEDLFFPGKSPDSDSDSESDSDFDHRNSALAEDPDQDEPSHDTDSTSVATQSAKSEEASAPPTHSSLASSPAPSPHPVSLSIRELAIAEDEETEAKGNDVTVSDTVHFTHNSTTSSTSLPYSRSSNRPMLRVKTQTNPTGIMGLHVTSRPLSQSKFSGSAISLLSSMGAAAGQPPYSAPSHASAARRSSMSMNSAPSPSSHEQPQISPTSPSINHAVNPKPPAKFSPFLLRTLPKPPTNPRDHSLLEMIYTEMLSARFINLAPLSILPNLLGLHFKDVRTHPPLQFTFPPLPARTNQIRAGRTEHTLSDDDESSDSDGARDAIVPRPSRRQSMQTTISQTSSHQEDSKRASGEARWLSMQGLIHNATPYITLDDARHNAFSPSRKASFPADSPTSPRRMAFSGKDLNTTQPEPGTPASMDRNTRAAAIAEASRQKSRLPNTTLNIDMGSLNLHLTLRMSEVLACSEPMWEWVDEYQGEHRKRQKTRVRSGSAEAGYSKKHIGSPFLNTGGNATDPNKAALLELTRDDFDSLLARFEMDMRDHIAMSAALQDRFNWTVVPSPPTTERKVFDAACERWVKWEREQRQKPSYHRLSRQHRAEGQLPQSPKPMNVPTQSAEGNGERKLKEKASTDRHSRQELATTTAPDSQLSPASSSHSTMIVPTRRLSRVMRVFVAWKA